MSREIFEYFIEPEELEPYYSRLRKVSRQPRVRLESLKATGPYDRDSGDDREFQSADQGKQEAEGDSVRDEKNVAESETSKPARPDDGSPGQSPLVLSETKPDATVDNSTNDDNRKVAATHRVRQFLSVHALGQYAFCVRSAILAAERGDDQDVDEPLPRLTYLPNFELERIEELLSEKLRTVGVSLLYFVSMVVLMAIGVLTQNRRLFYPILFISAGYLTWFGTQAIAIMRLIYRRRTALLAEANEPEPDFFGTQTANWWSMLKAGFEPVNYQRPFRHPELPLEGCPWRVLERGDLRIPVIRSGSAKLGPIPKQLFEKHQVRLAAYAILLECTEHVQVPYGLVFPSDSPKGLALEVTDALRAKAVRMLRELHLRLKESQQEKIEPRLPDVRTRCEKCRYGKPEQIELSELESKRRAGLQIVVLRSENEKFYHCDCADRFGSAPPHRDVNRLRLLAVIE
ncbi:MAG: hypothetical protein AAF497_04395 [Planctomycetota bacterium]